MNLRKRLNSKIGMTLIEIMIVIVLIATIMTVAAFGLGYLGRADVSAQALKFSSTVRYVFNLAATSNKTLQMKIDMDNQTLTVEELAVQGGLSEEDFQGTTMRSSEDAERKRRERLSRLNTDRARADELNAQAKRKIIVDDDEERKYRLDDEDKEFAALERTKLEGSFVSGDDTELTQGVYFIAVMTSHHIEEQSEGIATINFFPSGFVERAVIFIGDENAKNNEENGLIYSVVINPLTGQSVITPGKIELDTKFFEPQEDR